MAMVYLKTHNENIYNVENGAGDQQSRQRQQLRLSKSGKQQQLEASGLYMSRFRSMVKNESQENKLSHQTMGHARMPLSSPCNFLKKNAGVQNKTSRDQKSFKNKVPTALRLGQASKNAANENAPTESAENTKEKSSDKGDRKETRRTRPRYADTVNGTLHDLFSSGLTPQYIFRSTYGKVPDYISIRKQQIEAENGKRSHECKDEQSEVSARRGAKYISQMERLSLLSGLKENWEKLQKRYQLLPVLTDTEPKKISKVNLEKELRQLEQDIMLLENNPHIFVCANSNSGRRS